MKFQKKHEKKHTHTDNSYCNGNKNNKIPSNKLSKCIGIWLEYSNQIICLTLLLYFPLSFHKDNI